jgi:acyl carrier protein
MERNEIVAQLTTIASEIFQVENLVLTEDMSATNVETWTSLTFMQLLTAIEEHFGFKFKMMELIQIKNMGDIIRSIESHTN